MTFYAHYVYMQKIRTQDLSTPPHMFNHLCYN